MAAGVFGKVTKRPRIAILMGAPLSAQNFARTGVAFLAPHAELILLDCKAWLGRDTALAHDGSLAWPTIVEVANVGQFRAAVAGFAPDYALDFVGICPQTPLIQQVLADHGAAFVLQKSGALPMPSLWQRFWWAYRLRRLGRGGSGAALPHPALELPTPSAPPRPSLLRRVVNRLSFALRQRRPDLALMAGRGSKSLGARKILWVGSHDYHVFHTSAHSAPTHAPNDPYVVFVDDNLAYADDWTLLGLPAPVQPDHYFPAMRKFFAQIEQSWGVKVIVAAHPNAAKDARLAAGFAPFTLVHGQTAQAVRGARAVLLHASTATSFAVMAGKPMLFLITSQLLCAPYGLQIVNRAKVFGQVPLNIDNFDAIPALGHLHPNLRAYARYSDRFLCRAGHSEAAPWQNFITHITQPQHL